MNEELKKTIGKIIEKDFENFLKKISNNFNSNIFLCLVNISKIFNFDKKNHIEKYANNFHNDRWFSNHLKLFVLLEDVDKTNGPTIFIKKNQTKEFSKYLNYKSRINYLYIGN